MKALLSADLAASHARVGHVFLGLVGITGQRSTGSLSRIRYTLDKYHAPDDALNSIFENA